MLFVVFFFQAEDGIRDYKVTGVQTCALPICIGGILGTLLVGILASPNLGIFSGQGFSGANDSILSQFGVQALGVGVTIIYTAIVTWGLLKLTGLMTRGLRVTSEQETTGLDLALHDERGYDL